MRHFLLMISVSLIVGCTTQAMTSSLPAKTLLKVNVKKKVSRANQTLQTQDNVPVVNLMSNEGKKNA